MIFTGGDYMHRHHSALDEINAASYDARQATLKKTKKSGDNMADEKNTVETTQPADAGAQGKQQQISIRLERANVTFTNFTLVTGTPEEVIVDLGINTNMQQVSIDNRVGMTYATARRLAGALNETLRRFEQAVQQARGRQGGTGTGA